MFQDLNYLDIRRGFRNSVILSSSNRKSLSLYL